MRRAAVALALVLCAGPVSAQLYPRATEGPRTTDPAALRSLAQGREIAERFRRGFANEEAGKWREAADEFTRIVSLDPPEPQNATARYDLALAVARLGDEARAVALLEDAVHRDPGFAAAWANLVSLELLRGNLGAARTAADRFVALAPSSVRARYQRGLVALAAGDVNTARTDFRALLETDPSYAIAHYDLALVEQRDGRDEAARAELQRALALSPGYARARFALATVLLHEGLRTEARAEYERCARDANDATLRELALGMRDRL